MVKEFDFKNYIKRIKSDHMTVLSALFGGLKAEREIVKNGFNKQKPNE